VLTLPAKSRHDVAVVYFAAGGDEPVVRVLARHREAPKGDDFAADLLDVWDSDWAKLGAIRRIDAGEGGKGTVGYAWHDDRARVRTFGAKTEHGPCCHRMADVAGVAQVAALARAEQALYRCPTEENVRNFASLRLTFWRSTGRRTGRANRCGNSTRSARRTTGCRS